MKLRELSERSFCRSGCERSEFPDKYLYLASPEDCQVTPTAQPDLQPVHGFARHNLIRSFIRAEAAGQKNGQSDQKRNFGKENIELRIMNIECRRNVSCLFYKKRMSKAKPPFEILRFAVWSNEVSHEQSPRAKRQPV